MLDRFLPYEEEPLTDDDREWDAFVASHPNGSLLQTTSWARLKNRFGWRSQRVWLRRDGRLVAGAQMLVRSAVFGLINVAYVPHGPLVDWADGEQVSILLNQLDFAAYEQRAALLKIEPLVWQTDLPQSQWETICQEQGCIPTGDTIQPPRTIVVDLRPAEEEILARMKQKTRYNIRISAKKGVVVRRGSAREMDDFVALMNLTADRNEFGIHRPDYYRMAYDLFAPEQAALMIAEYQGQPLSALMVFAQGKRAAYLYGASSDKERQRMPNYAVQWAAMQWAREQGCTEYDLWGVPDRPEEELEANFRKNSDGLWGVYRFKRGFGGQVKRTVGTADRVYNNLVYRLYKWRQGR